MSKDVVYKEGPYEIRNTSGISGLYDFSLYHNGTWNASFVSYRQAKDLLDIRVRDNKIEKLEAENKRLKRKVNRLLTKIGQLKESLEVQKY